MSVWRRLCLAAMVVVASGCSSLSLQERDRAEAVAVAGRSTLTDCTQDDNCALDSPLRSLAGEAFSQSTAAEPRHFATLLDEGEASLVARLNLIRSATRRIDLQTYIFDTDDSARLVIDELLAASRRGVRVRVLIDQLSAITDLQTLAALSGAHENFQLRIYNPTFGKARLHYLDYAASVICCFRRFNQRMHNKLLVIDDAIGIVGGRNYQDDYYDWDNEYNFRDRDVILSGPEARAMAANFEAFWQAPRSIPAERLNDVGRFLLRQGVPALPAHSFRSPERVARVDARAADPDWVRERFVDTALPVNQVRYVADLPGKHRSETEPVDPADSVDLEKLIGNARTEVLLQTPYLIVSDAAQDTLRALRQRETPPRIRVSTNSLAATDNPVVYALSYKFKRRNMRELGLDINEYKPFPLTPPVSEENRAAPVPVLVEREAEAMVPAPLPARQRLDFGARRLGTYNARGELRRRQPGGSEVERDVLRSETRPTYLGSRAVNKPLPVTGDGVRMGLHAKSMVIDREVAVIGTHNFDPRSENYNTEGMVVIADPAFARLLADSIERDMDPTNAWVVAPRPKAPLVGQLNYNVARASEALPVMDFWPWRYGAVYEYQPSAACPQPLSRRDPGFYECYRSLGDFPGVNVGGKWLLVRMLTAFGAGLVPIL